MNSNTDDTEGQDQKAACDACGKGDCSLKLCTACKSVQYCGVECQKSHRKRHRAMCNRRQRDLATEAALAALPPKPECPICCLPMPIKEKYSTYLTCCGKTICLGCQFGVIKQIILSEEKGRSKTPSACRYTCAFCRQPPLHNDQAIASIQNRVDKGDAEAMYQLSMSYIDSQCKEQKASDLLHRASDLGHNVACYVLSELYGSGDIGLDIDKSKERELLERAAGAGYLPALYDLGRLEATDRNFDAAFCHYRVAASRGMQDAVPCLFAAFNCGKISKDELADTLRACQAAQDEVKSDERDAAKKIKDSKDNRGR